MAEKTHPKKYLERGEIDATRRNIGPIDASEAAKMTKVLGGEILREKGMGSASRAPIKRSRPSSGEAQAGDTERHNASTTPQRRRPENLPVIDSKEWAKMNKIMKDSEYGVRPNYGIFSFLERFMKSNKDRVSRSYAQYSLKFAVDHMQAFITIIKTIIQKAPDTYKIRITNDHEMKFKFLRMVENWSIRDIKTEYTALGTRYSEITLQMLIPFTRTLYKQLVTVYYLGEERVAEMLRDIQKDLSVFPDARKTYTKFIKEAITEWFTINAKVIKETYPLLMRMCSPTFDVYPHFFISKITNILAFVGITRFEILVPEKKKKPEEIEEEPKEEEHKEEKEEKKSKAPQNDVGQMTPLVEAGLNLLERLFPDAGFKRLKAMPDMYPYFDPIYDFDDGYNMLAPDNPMQITVVLLKIIEDLFQGCRNIKFKIESSDSINDLKDNFNEAMNDWSLYREDLFEKHYNEHLKTFVNELYTKSDYGSTQYGKKLMSNILWETKYNFLPHFQFQQLLLERPINDSKYRPLFIRTDYLRKVFTILAGRIDKAAPDKNPVEGVANPWDRYVFDLPNPVSKRLDVLLGAKKVENTSATNANLLKYTMCILSVIDWWVNNEESPAYSTSNKSVYRISEKDGGPAFSVPMRSDQNQLFAQSIKAANAKRAAAAERKAAAEAQEAKKAEEDAASNKEQSESAAPQPEENATEGKESPEQAEN